MTVEGSLDDISAPHQTISAHRLCKNIPTDMHYNHLQDGAGHYGIFNGRGWRGDIRPRLAGFMREMASRQGIEYSPAETIAPTPWHVARARDYTQKASAKGQKLAA